VTVVALAATLGSLLGQGSRSRAATWLNCKVTGTSSHSALVAAIGLIALYGLGMQVGFDNVLRLAGLSVRAAGLLTARAALWRSSITITPTVPGLRPRLARRKNGDEPDQNISQRVGTAWA
jgi:hypothetical protein